METVALLLYAVSLINLALAGLVFWRNRTAEVNRVFALTALSVAVWTLTNGLFQATDSVATATLWANISYVSSIVVGASLFHFSLIYPERLDRPHRHLDPWLAWGLWIAAAILCFTPFVPHFIIDHLELVPTRKIVTNAGLLPLALYLFATVLGAMHSLLRSLVATHGRQRMQARYVLVGMTVTAIFGLVCNLVFPLTGNYSWVWLGPASSIIFVGSAVYSIVKERLFDIRIIMHRILVYGLLVAGISGIYSGIEYTTADVLQRSSAGDGHPLMAQIGGAIVVSLCFNPVRKWLERRLNRIVFRRASHREHRG